MKAEILQVCPLPVMSRRQRAQAEQIYKGLFKSEFIKWRQENFFSHQVANMPDREEMLREIVKLFEIKS